MRGFFGFLTKDIWLSLAIFFLLGLSITVLSSIAKDLFPVYFIYIVVAIAAFWFFSQLGFEAVSVFSSHLYVFSILLLVINLIIGSVTRGTVRWIPIGPISLQPAELVRPFLLVFFAVYLTSGKFDMKKFVKAIFLLGLPAFLILVQPSLGVSVLTVTGFLGVLIATNFNKKYIFAGIGLVLLLVPVFWKLMAPYQQERILSFISPASDKLGAGYNSCRVRKIDRQGIGEGDSDTAFVSSRKTDRLYIFRNRGRTRIFGCGFYDRCNFYNSFQAYRIYGKFSKFCRTGIFKWALSDPDGSSFYPCRYEHGPSSCYRTPLSACLFWRKLAFGHNDRLGDCFRSLPKVKYTSIWQNTQ